MSLCGGSGTCGNAACCVSVTLWHVSALGTCRAYNNSAGSLIMRCFQPEDLFSFPFSLGVAFGQWSWPARPLDETPVAVLAVGRERPRTAKASQAHRRSFYYLYCIHAGRLLQRTCASHFSVVTSATWPSKLSDCETMGSTMPHSFSPLQVPQMPEAVLIDDIDDQHQGTFHEGLLQGPQRSVARQLFRCTPLAPSLAPPFTAPPPSLLPDEHQ